MTQAHEQRLAQIFVTLSDTLVDEFDVLDFLALLAEQAVALLDVTAAWVLLSDQRGELRLTAGSSEHAELVAAQARQGPCRDCLDTGAPVASPDLTADIDRWPDFAAAAVRSGYHAAHALPMRLRDQTIGVLTLIDRAPGGIDEHAARLGQALADTATISILQHRAVHREEVLTEQLQATLHWRDAVEQATGMVAQYAHLDTHQAHTLLREHAHQHRLRLGELARNLADGTIDLERVAGPARKHN
jgi:GAF domain-containing protein